MKNSWQASNFSIHQAVQCAYAINQEKPNIPMPDFRYMTTCESSRTLPHNVLKVSALHIRIYVPRQIKATRVFVFPLFWGGSNWSLLALQIRKSWLSSPFFPAEELQEKCAPTAQPNKLITHCESIGTYRSVLGSSWFQPWGSWTSHCNLLHCTVMTKNRKES